MRVLICYDVDTTDKPGARRLRRIAEACKDHGVRVQYSVFECQLQTPAWIQLRRRLLELFESQTDSLRFYFFGEDEAQKAEHHGVRPPLDMSGPLLV